MKCNCCNEPFAVSPCKKESVSYTASGYQGEAMLSGGAAAKLRAFPSSFALLAKKRRGFSFGSILPFLDSELPRLEILKRPVPVCALHARRGA